jgi:hypothetical protein
MDDVMKEEIQQVISQTTDLKAGVVLVSTGSLGSFAQAITEWSNNIVAGGNALLIIGGLFLMYHKIKEAHFKTKKHDRRKGD